MCPLQFASMVRKAGNLGFSFPGNVCSLSKIFEFWEKYQLFVHKTDRSLWRNLEAQGFFSKFLMGGLKIFGPRQGPTATKSAGGELAKKSNWSQNCPLNAKLGHFFAIFKHEIQLFQVLLSLKVVKFDTKMYLNFSNFWGRTSAGEAQALVQKQGQVSDGGGLTKFLPDGGPSVSPGKKTLVWAFCTQNWS